MVTGKSQLLQLTLSAMTFVIVLGALSMIWPGIIALCIGVLLLLHSCSAGQEIAVLSWPEVGHATIVYASTRRPGLSSTLA